MARVRIETQIYRQLALTDSKVSEKFGEPWKYHKVEAGKQGWPVHYSIRRNNDDGTSKYAVARTWHEEDAKIISECVNAMKGIEDPKAFMEAVRELEKRVNFYLEQMINNGLKGNATSFLDQALRNLRAARGNT